ncbi:MAG: glycosyltransferase [Deltaproteobacteria bacterium]|nr:glycosyltransferase [Deltaproteobacteria bacterium]
MTGMVPGIPNLHLNPITQTVTLPLIAQRLMVQPQAIRAINDEFLESLKPHVLLLSTHGYAATDFSVRAKDSGGQIEYVNHLARSLVDIGYKVTIGSRSFTPQKEFAAFGDRQGVAFLEGANFLARYLFIPGDKEEFILKEDIYPELPIMARHLSHFVAYEAGLKGVKPWEYFSWVNSHYVDAGRVAQGLISRWQRAITVEHIVDHFRPVLTDLGGSVLQRAWESKDAIDASLHHNLGEEVMNAWENEHQKSRTAADLPQVARWVGRRLKWEHGQLAAVVQRVGEGEKVRLDSDTAKARLGEVLLKEVGDFADLQRKLASANRHAWTPHSLGIVKRDNMLKVAHASGGDPAASMLESSEIYSKLHFERRIPMETELVGAAITGHTLSGQVFSRWPSAQMVGITSEEIGDGLSRIGASTSLSRVFFPPGANPKVSPHDSIRSDRVQKLLAFVEEKAAPEARSVLQSLRGAPQKYSIVVEAGRMDPTKRKHILIEAMRYMPKETLLWMTGGDPEDPKDLVYRELQALVKAYELEEQVVLLGDVPRDLMPVLMGLPYGNTPDSFHMAMGVTASRMEGWGMFAEDVTAGLMPLIASEFVPYAQLAKRKNKGAIIIPIEGEDEPFRYAQAMKGLIDNPEKGHELARRGFQFSHEFRWSPLTRNFAKAAEKAFFHVSSQDEAEAAVSKI